VVKFSGNAQVEASLVMNELTFSGVADDVAQSPPRDRLLAESPGR
jgi:hypothetical protein